MPDITFNCPHCQQSIEAPDEMVGMQVDCPTCHKGFQVPRKKIALRVPPATQPSSPAPPFKRSPVSHSTFKPSATFTGPASLSCRSCGAQLDYKENSDIATCPFCGSTNFLFEPTSETDRLRDMEDGSFRVLHYEPQLSDAQVRQCIMEAVQRDPVGCLKIGDVSWKIERVFFPVWQVEAQVHCTWHGIHEERIPFTNYETETRHRSETVLERSMFGGEKQWVTKDVPYEENVAYVDYRIQPNPVNGVHDFEHILQLPAAVGISSDQLVRCGFDRQSGPLKDGRPSTVDTHAVARLCVSQSSSWSKVNGNQLIQQEAEAQCRAAVSESRISSVSCVIQSKRFSLVYLPVALVSYDREGQNYRHFVNLVTGVLGSNDWPKDYPRALNQVTQVISQARHDAQQHVEQLRKQNQQFEVNRNYSAQAANTKAVKKFLIALGLIVVVLWLRVPKGYIPDDANSWGEYGFQVVGVHALRVFGPIVALALFLSARKSNKEAKATERLQPAPIPSWDQVPPWQDSVRQQRTTLLHYFTAPTEVLASTIYTKWSGQDNVVNVNNRISAFLDGRTGASQEAELIAVTDHVAKRLLGDYSASASSQANHGEHIKESPLALPGTPVSSETKHIGCIVTVVVVLFVLVFSIIICRSCNSYKDESSVSRVSAKGIAVDIDVEGWGRVEAKDYVEAAKLFRRSADMGCVSAMYDLGRLYENGQGVAKDHTEAVKWIRMAADLGNADAIAYLHSLENKPTTNANMASETYTYYRQVHSLCDLIAERAQNVSKILTLLQADRRVAMELSWQTAYKDACDRLIEIPELIPPPDNSETSKRISLLLAQVATKMRESGLSGRKGIEYALTDDPKATKDAINLMGARIYEASKIINDELLPLILKIGSTYGN